MNEVPRPWNLSAARIAASKTSPSLLSGALMVVFECVDSENADPHGMIALMEKNLCSFEIGALAGIGRRQAARPGLCLEK